MGAAESSHTGHSHHKAIKGKVLKTFEEDGVIVLSDEELHHLWQHYDDNKNDLLDKSELELMITDLISHTVEDKTERENLLKHITQHDSGNIVDVVYAKLVNKDGVVTFADFVKTYHVVIHDFNKLFKDYKAKKSGPACCVVS